MWAADGSAGNDPAQSPVSSGTQISPDQFRVNAETTAVDGQKLELIYDSDMRAEDVYINFVTDTGPCSVAGRVEPTLVTDDFDDSNYNGWTVQTGNWTVQSRELLQSNDAGVFQWIHTSSLSHGGDFILEADMQVQVGGYALIQFNRDTADSRYMAYLSAWAHEAHLGRYTTVYTDFAFGYQTINEGAWYKTKIVKEGDVYQLFVNCQLIAQGLAFPSPPSGRFGFGAYYSKVRVDDIIITENTEGAVTRVASN